MAIAGQYALETDARLIPATMLAAVYRGVNDVRSETVPVPEIGAKEILVRVHSCGVCGTDLKKISTGSHSAPRIFGHETSGTVAAVGQDVRNYSPGDRVMVFHHMMADVSFNDLQHQAVRGAPESGEDVQDLVTILPGNRYRPAT